MSLRATIPSAFLCLAAIGCGPPNLHVPNSPPASTYLEHPDGSSAGASLGDARLKPSVCEGIDVREESHTLDANDFVAFLRSRGLQAEITEARSNLVYVDVTNAGTSKPLRFRVAILQNAGAAGRDLHVALLQHGHGRWGVHRGNLAVLAPEGTLDDIVAFASRTKLACWGVLTIAGVDDTYVVAGGYAEL